MYELKKIGKVFTSKSVGTGPSSFGKKNSPVRGLTQVETHWSKEWENCRPSVHPHCARHPPVIGD